MNARQREELFEMRRLLDEMVKNLQLVSEAAFNASAAAVNEHRAAIRTWLEEADYSRGDVAIDPDDKTPYWAMHANGKSTGQVRKPSASPTVWTHCHGTTPETAREFVSEGHNPYMQGHYCKKNGRAYRCLENNTIHAPDVYPQAWEEVG